MATPFAPPAAEEKLYNHPRRPLRWGPFAIVCTALLFRAVWTMLFEPQTEPWPYNFLEWVYCNLWANFPMLILLAVGAAWLHSLWLRLRGGRPRVGPRGRRWLLRGLVIFDGLLVSLLSVALFSSINDHHYVVCRALAPETEYWSPLIAFFPLLGICGGILAGTLMFEISRRLRSGREIAYLAAVAAAGHLALLFGAVLK